MKQWIVICKPKKKWREALVSLVALVMARSHAQALRQFESVRGELTFDDGLYCLPTAYLAKRDQIYRI